MVQIRRVRKKAKPREAATVSIELTGHTRQDGAVQRLEDHLHNVAGLSDQSAESFGASAWGSTAGLLHDDGCSMVSV